MNQRLTRKEIFQINKIKPTIARRKIFFYYFRWLLISGACGMVVEILTAPTRNPIPRTIINFWKISIALRCVFFMLFIYFDFNMSDAFIPLVFPMKYTEKKEANQQTTKTE